MKHAYLIIAHNSFRQLQLLLNLLDDARNDIYVHIDKKSEFPQLDLPKYSNLEILERRLDVRWGDISQIEVEILLFKEAYKKGPYMYYHLLSGVDFPIKTNDYIHDFFTKHEGLEFIGFGEPFFDRCTKYHFFTRHLKNKNKLEKYFWIVLRTICEKIANSFKKSFPADIEIKSGANWVSITNDFCGYLISKENYILENFKYGICCDEVFIQTIFWNSPFKFKNFYGDTGYPYERSIRLIDWERGDPYVWGADPEYDYQLIRESRCLFARKFDLEKYPKFTLRVVGLIHNNIKE